MTAKAEIRIGPLNSVGGVLNELARVYREARRGQLDLSDATRLAMILREIRSALESGDIERRIDALEAIDPPPRLRRIA